MKINWEKPATSKSTAPWVAVLLGTYNGAKFLREQINSIAKQTYPNIAVWVSDDGSTDQTILMLREAQQVWGEDRFVIFNGPKRGHIQNFLTLICRKDINTDYFALCDQDDIWLPNKIARALEYLSNEDPIKPCLYGSAYFLMNSKGEPSAPKYLTKKPQELEFRRAICENFASGNTMVFNKNLQTHIQKAGSQVEVASHDWWLFLMVTGIGGVVFFDSRPSLLYRQHKTNLIGANVGLKSKINRARLMLSGRSIRWFDSHCACLQKIQPSLAPSNIALLNLIALLNTSSRFKRLLMFKDFTICRHSYLETLIFKLVVLIRKFRSARTI